jgi:hypothetical protein
MSQIIADLQVLVTEYHALKERVTRSDVELERCRKFVSEIDRELLKVRECISSKDKNIGELDTKILELRGLLGFRNECVTKLTIDLKKSQELIASKDKCIAKLKKLIALKDLRIAELNSDLKKSQELIVQKELRIAELSSTPSKELRIAELNSDLKKSQELIVQKELRIAELNSDLKKSQELIGLKDLRIADLSSTLSNIRKLAEEEHNAAFSSSIIPTHLPNSIYAHLQGILKDYAYVDEDLFEKILLTNGKSNGNFVCGVMITDAIMGKKEPREYYIVNIGTYDVPYMLSLLSSLDLTQYGSKSSNRFSKNRLSIYVYEIPECSKASKNRLSVYKDFIYHVDEAFFDFDNVYDCNYSRHYKQSFPTFIDTILPQEIVYKYDSPTCAAKLQ